MEKRLHLVDAGLLRNATRQLDLHQGDSGVGPENSCRLIMLKIFFHIAMLRPYELPFLFRDQFSDGRVALPTFPTA
jgi:hypothetical protein